MVYRKSLGAAFLGAVLFALLASPLAAGVVFEIETTYHDRPDGRSERSRVAVDDAHLKMEIRSSGRRAELDEVVFRRGDRQMLVIDHAEKSYMVMDAATMKRVGGQMSEMQKQMQARLKDLPPEQRAMVEKMMKQRMPAAAAQPKPPELDVRKTGEKAKKAGYPCVRYDVFRDGDKTLEMWVTDWDNVEGSAAMRDVFLDMSKFYSEMMAPLAKMAGPGGSGMASGHAPLQVFAELDGFPVVTRSFAGGELENESVLQSARRAELDPAEFEPPAGYKRRSMGP